MDKFGNQDLFAGSPDNAVLAIHVKYTGGLNEIYSFAAVDEIKLLQGGYKVEEIHIAARLPKKQPQWTWEDKKAGRLPEVGVVCVGIHSKRNKRVVHVNKTHAVCEFLDEKTIIVITHKDFFDNQEPIETPEEKENRLREEFVRHVCKDLGFEKKLNMEGQRIAETAIIAAYDEMQRRNKE